MGAQADEFLGEPRLGDAMRQSIAGLSPEGPNIELWPLFTGLAQSPVLVLRGENSDLLSAATVEKMRAVKPDLAGAIVERRGHAPFLDEPEAIGAIDSFLGDIA